MLKGIDLNQRIEYVSKYDSSEPKTVFVFKPLAAAEMIDVMGDQTTTVLKGSKIIDYLDMVICEVRNAEFSDKRSFLNSLPSLIISELVAESSGMNNMTLADQKNS